MKTLVQIKVNGKPIDQYKHEGMTFIEAREGTEYIIEIKNNDNQRKLAIITVDGINVISGLPQDQENGYVINNYSSFEIKGFRKDLDTVGAFKFCKRGLSYCNEQGLKGNNGVIGIRLYNEKIYPILYRNTFELSDFKITNDNSTSKTDSSSSCYSVKTEPCESVKSKSFALGTTWGKKINDTVKTVNFETDNEFQEIIIYYDSRKNLEKMGISFKKENQIVMPKAFGGFANPPKGW